MTVIVPSVPRQCLCCCRHNRVRVQLLNVEPRQAAVDPQTRPVDLSCDATCKLLSAALTIPKWTRLQTTQHCLSLQVCRCLRDDQYTSADIVCIAQPLLPDRLAAASKANYISSASSAEFSMTQDRSTVVKISLHLSCS